MHATTAGIQVYGREMRPAVPTMTSNTTPYGTANGSSRKGIGASDFYQACVPFADNTNGWSTETGIGHSSIYYQFTTPQKLKGRVSFYLVTAQSGGVGQTINVKVIGSNDGTTWTELTTTNTLTMVMYNNSPPQYNIEVNSNNYYYEIYP